MSTRVEEDAHKRAEAERLQKKLDKNARDAKSTEKNRAAFGKLVRAGQRTAETTKDKALKAQHEEHHAEQEGEHVAKEAHSEAQAARLARSGIQKQTRAMQQAKGFQGVLNKNATATQSADTGRFVRRQQGVEHDRVERDDRKVDLDKKETAKEMDAEAVQLDARNAALPNAAIDADGKGESDGRGREGAGALGAVKAAQLQAAQGAAPAHEVKQIPAELLDKLVSAVHLAVNDKGLKEFQIELKDGPLKGARMRVSAEDGKVSLRFENLDQNSKRLIEASKGDLMRRLDKKGLSLARLETR